MTDQIVRLPAFSVLGFTARTTNEQEMSGKGHIGQLWQTYMGTGSAMIPGVTDPSLTFSIYTNYQSDHTGAYDVILGKPVSSLESPPKPLQGIAIPAAEYLMFTAENPSPDSIRAAWMKVYEYFSGQQRRPRAFTADFERYSNDGVQLYIAV
jgi:predicted transcriptional regulator YdeE